MRSETPPTPGDKNPQTKRGKGVLRSGSLRIGDQWNAIEILAHSQTHPLKAVCELIENAIDARARHVIVMRRKQQGEIFLEVADDGGGIALNASGEPDYEHIATHICDSMKRRLHSDDRSGVHGEFGIGLSSFWSLGRELRMISSAQNGALRELHLGRGKRTFRVRAVRGEFAGSGTKVVVGPLLESTRKIVTADKLQRYLAVELRDRIRRSGVEIRLVDRVSRRSVIVVPSEFQGERLQLQRSLETPFGPLSVELFYRSTSAAERSSISLCKDGTRVLAVLSALLNFEHFPWTSEKLEGIIDYPALNLAPGTRSGIVPDERLAAMEQALREIEPQITAALEAFERAEIEKADSDIQRQIQRAFTQALCALPLEEYLFFDVAAEPPAPGKKGPSAASSDPSIALPSAEQTPAPQAAPSARAEQLLLPTGELAAVRISPRSARVRPGEETLLNAKALDTNRVAILEGIEFSWQLAPDSQAALFPDGRSCRVRSETAGSITVRVLARQAEKEVVDEVALKFIEGLLDSEIGTQSGLPGYHLQAAHGQRWRSFYNRTENVIVINSAHRDFALSRQSAAKHRRYVAKLYAKEVVLLNFPHEAPAEVMERMVEMMLRIEDAL